MQTALEQYDAAAENHSISVEELDRLAITYKEHYDEHRRLKNATSNAYANLQEAETKLVSALKQAGRRKYQVDGIGVLGFVERSSVKTPKTACEKQQLAQYLREKGGEELFWHYFGVNSQSLQGFYKGELEEWKMKAEIAAKEGQDYGNFSIPGIEAPVSSTTLQILSKEK